MKDYIIFGCGGEGKKILEEIGTKNVFCFIDNDVSKQGKYWKNVPIMNLNEAVTSGYKKKILVPATGYYTEAKKQLDEKGIVGYSIYQTEMREGVQGTLIYNPYVYQENMTYKRDDNSKILINDFAKQLYYERPLFQGIEIETFNRCNGGCEFCPVSMKNDTRKEYKMEEELFRKIIDELADLEYAGKIALFSNNEPFLDDRIVQFQEYVRKKLSNAYCYIYTNGTVLNLDTFKKIIGMLDEMIIDNYNQNLELLPSVKKIVDYCENDEELRRKVTVVLRKPKEILTTRGGDAPNSTLNSNIYACDSCTLPFKQMIVRPDGKVSLCCNDPLGKYTLGDLRHQSIKEIWWGEEFNAVRDLILCGRKNLEKCKWCDTFYI